MADAKNNANDFAQMIQEENFRRGFGNLSMFPPKEDIVDPTLDMRVKGEEDLISAPKQKYQARYGRFNIGVAGDRLELERIQNSIMNDKWLPGREEWNTTEEGDMIITMKWLQPIEEVVKR